MNILTKISDYLNSLNSADNLLIIWYPDDERAIKVFSRDYNGAYMTAARYIYGIFCMWTTYNGVTKTVEDLFDLCANDNDFGDILELYVETDVGDFKRV